MSNLDDAPFRIHDKVTWTTKKGRSRFKTKRVGVIIDAFYQQKTSSRNEGWRLLIVKDSVDGDDEYLEKNFDQINLLSD